MPQFISKLVGLFGEAQGWLLQILIPIAVVMGLFFLIMFGVSSDQNKGKWKGSLMILFAVIIGSAAIIYVIPWVHAYFQ